jgi:hypothetical protein
MRANDIRSRSRRCLYSFEFLYKLCSEVLDPPFFPRRKRSVGRNGDRTKQRDLVAELLNLEEGTHEKENYIRAAGDVQTLSQRALSFWVGAVGESIAANSTSMKLKQLT